MKPAKLQKNTNLKNDLLELTVDYYKSLLTFTQHFYYKRTGREFSLSYPDGRESHFLTIINALEKIIRGETKRLIINVPPRYG